jgi:hypothetical protein
LNMHEAVSLRARQLRNPVILIGALANSYEGPFQKAYEDQVPMKTKCL